MYLKIRKLSAVLAIFLTNYALGAYMPMQSGTIVEPATVESAREMMWLYPSSATLVLPELSYQEEQKITELIAQKNRVYLTIQRDVSVNDSNWKLVGSKETFNIWQLHIKSSGAVGMQALFSKATLTPELKIKIYSGQNAVTSHIGEYSGSRSEHAKDFWSTKVPGNTIVIEAWVAQDSNLQPDTFPFAIKAINHYFREGSEDFPALKNFLGGSQIQQSSCPVNNNLCINDNTRAYSAISLITYTPPRGPASLCTGSFLSSPGGELYLLTAFHCIYPGSSQNMRKGNDINAQIWTSQSPCAISADQLVGNDIKFIAASEKADWALLWVDKNSLQRADGLPFLANTPTLLGWNGNSLAIGSLLETLHYGERNLQSYAQFQMTELEYVIGDGGTQQDPTFFEACQGNGCTHYRISAIRGGIAEGASGSSWWGSNPRDYQIRGVTTHGLNTCSGFASRFDKIFEDGRVQCALTDGDRYYPVATSTCDDSARPFYDNTLPSLTNLSLSVGDLYPTFDSARTIYIATVADSTTQLTLNLRAANSNQEITVNGNVVTASTTLPLSPGDNTITITVNTADNSATETYTVKVIRVSEQNFEPIGTWKSTAFENVDIQCPLGLIALDPIGSEYNIVQTSSGLFNIIDNDDSIYTEISRQQPNRYTFRYMESFSIPVEGVQLRGNQSDTITTIQISDEQVIAVGFGAISTSNFPNIPCTINYMVKFERTDRSSIALKNLSISSGQLNPSFDSKIKHYTVNVDSHVGQLTIIPTANHSGQRITINGTTVSNGIGTTLPLNIGDNTISIAVTSADRKATASYTIVVTRQMPYLTRLALSTGQLNPNFNSQTTRYTTTVSSDVGQIRLSLASNGINNIITTANGNLITNNIVPLDIGSNTINISVTTPDSKATASYTIVVTRQMPYLTHLTLSTGQLNPNFNSRTSRYTTTVSSDVAQIRLSSTSNGNNNIITMTANGNPITNNIVPLNVGSNTIIVSVATPDRKATTSYIIVATRSQPCLTALSLSVGTITPNFSRPGVQCADTTINYKATVGNDVSQVNVTATANSNAHTITINGSQNAMLALDVGNNTATIVVATVDGTGMQSYHLTIRRLSTATLTDLSVIATAGTTTQELTLKPEFNSIILNYAITINSTLTSINLIPAVDAGRTITVRYTPQNGSAINQPLASGDSIAITLSDSINTIYIDVAHNTAMEQYRLTVHSGILVRARVFLEGALR